MGSVALFCIGTALPCHNINIGHHVQGHGSRQQKHSPVHKHTAHPLDNKAPVEPVCRDDGYAQELDALFTTTVGNMLRSHSLRGAIEQLCAAHAHSLHGRSIRVIDARHCP